MTAIHLLQNKALDSSITMTELLRLAYSISVKLNLTDFQKWLYSEMYGYKSVEDLPEYRFIQGIMLAFNPVLGWQTVKIYDSKIIEYLRRIAMTDKISEIEHLLEHSEHLQFVYRELPLKIRKHFAENNFGMGAVIMLNDQKLAGIADAVRNKILEWSLSLEQKEILGEEMSFNKDEISAAQAVTINNYITDNKINAPIQQGYSNFMKMDSQSKSFKDFKTLIEYTKQFMKDIPEGADKEELKSNLETLELQLKSPKPNKNILQEAGKSIRNILEGSFGSLISSMPVVAETFQKLIN